MKYISSGQMAVLKSTVQLINDHPIDMDDRKPMYRSFNSPEKLAAQEYMVSFINGVDYPDLMIQLIGTPSDIPRHIKLTNRFGLPERQLVALEDVYETCENLDKDIKIKGYKIHLVRGKAKYTLRMLLSTGMSIGLNFDACNVYGPNEKMILELVEEFPESIRWGFITSCIRGSYQKDLDLLPNDMVHRSSEERLLYRARTMFENHFLGVDYHSYLPTNPETGKQGLTMGITAFKVPYRR